MSRGLGILYGAPPTPLRPRPKHCFGKDSRGTPPEIYAELNREFSFTLDPCPLDDSPTAGAPLWGKDGLALDWRGQRVFCNPPYSAIKPWLCKHGEAELAVYLLPVKTDLGWWHDYIMTEAQEVRLFRGRLRFVAMTGGAPFPSCVVVFRHGLSGPPVWRSIQRPPRVAVLTGSATSEGRSIRPPSTLTSARAGDAELTGGDKC